MSPVITLLTDFGTSDGYVAAMKGVILALCPPAVIVDVTHEVPAQDVLTGAFVLTTCYRYFPEGTIHVVVVDPGVGSARRAVLVEAAGFRFLAPDNGVLTLALRDSGFATPASGSVQPSALPLEVRGWVLDNRALWRPEVSRTFHGRDIFAPVAAHLALGMPPDRVGPGIDYLLALPLPRPRRSADGRLQGEVLHVDRFGNLITNIREEDLTGDAITVEIGERRIDGLSSSYAEGGDLLAIVGSSGYLEIAMANGSAARTLATGRGATVAIETTGG